MKEKKENFLQIELNRFMENKFQVLGSMLIAIPDIEHDLTIYTLEPPWKNNEKFVSCIPAGTYRVEMRCSKKHGHHFILKDVKDRTHILIHSLNYYFNTEGCIGVGTGLKDIDGDGLLDITRSKYAMKFLNRTLPNVWYLKINNLNGVCQDAPKGDPE